ncbi:unnamed protein product [Rangifer tarandus platyrhynchus]|uniref:Uncharacterized protein n=2 Tax=Rangifer tarandus platyrhynchus TaxID=3082113 RepID=A0ACB0E7A7_RANTA|nr:unnamed protein product [Rangifer tarandus platyrhynchus]CAI9696487.1 unnamed protein product [Rangifer tarandus platyrhynchus]
MTLPVARTQVASLGERPHQMLTGTGNNGHPRALLVRPEPAAFSTSDRARGGSPRHPRTPGILSPPQATEAPG